MCYSEPDNALINTLSQVINEVSQLGQSLTQLTVGLPYANPWLSVGAQEESGLEPLRKGIVYCERQTRKPRSRRRGKHAVASDAASLVLTSTRAPLASTAPAWAAGWGLLGRPVLKAADAAQPPRTPANSVWISGVELSHGVRQLPQTMRDPVRPARHRPTCAFSPNSAPRRGCSVRSPSPAWAIELQGAAEIGPSGVSPRGLTLGLKPRRMRF